MSTLEQDLRTTFAAVADEAPLDTGLLSRVSVRARRRTRTRWVAAVAGVAGAAVLVVAVAALGGGKPSSLDYAHDPATFFQDGSSLEIREPYVLQVPAALTARRLDGTPDGFVLDWRTPAGARSAALTMSVSSRVGNDQDVDSSQGAVTTETTTVRGHQASLRCNPYSCVVAWREAPSVFISVLYQPAAPADRRDVVAIASTLRKQPVVATQHVVLARVPKGCRLAEVFPNATILTGSRDCQHVYASVLTSKTFTINGKSIQVDGRDAVLGSYGVAGDPLAPLSYRLQVELADGRVLEVMAPKQSGWDESLLVEFARSVHVPEAA